MKRVLVRIRLPEIHVNAVTDEYIKECDRRAPVNSVEQDKLIAYVNNAHHAAIHLDLTESIFAGERIPHARTLLSDGEWLWSADLNHYTEKHNFVWPEEFIQSVKSKKYKMPDITEENLSVLGLLAEDISLKFMVEMPVNVPGALAYTKLPKISTYHVDEL